MWSTSFVCTPLLARCGALQLLSIIECTPYPSHGQRTPTRLAARPRPQRSARTQPENSKHLTVSGWCAQSMFPLVCFRLRKTRLKFTSSLVTCRIRPRILVLALCCGGSTRIFRKVRNQTLLFTHRQLRELQKRSSLKSSA